MGKNTVNKSNPGPSKPRKQPKNKSDNEIEKDNKSVVISSETFGKCMLLYPLFFGSDLSFKQRSERKAGDSVQLLLPKKYATVC